MALSGMGMMLKSFGIDPEEIKSSIEAFMAQTKTAVEEIRANQKTLEAKDDLIIENQQHMNLMLGLLIQEKQGSSRMLENEKGESLGILETSEKFPTEVIEAAAISQGFLDGEKHEE